MKEYDIILWGATGYTGRLVAEYLGKRYSDQSKLKWAMAGRNKSKLDEVQAITDTQGIPQIIADSNDISSLDAMTSKAKVICTTVGPYAKYGSDLVASCVKNETNYCDLTGEVQWIRKMIDNHHEEAEKSKVKIVHCCGFDSVPSDMGVFYTQTTLKEKLGQYAKEIQFYVRIMKGKFSGGTLASLQNVMAEAAVDKSIYKTLFNPYGLNPKGEMSGPDRQDLVKPRYNKELKSWLGPFVMAGINTKVVRRSHALNGYPYGKDFGYSESTLTGPGFQGRMRANGLMLTMGMASAMKPGTILKKVGDRFLPQPGEGPTKEERETGFYKLLLIAKMRDGSSKTIKVTGDRDPGYGSTSKMLGEAAVCLAKDETTDKYGCITPSLAMGQKYLNRLIQNAGLTFEIED